MNIDELIEWLNSLPEVDRKAQIHDMEFMPTRPARVIIRLKTYGNVRRITMTQGVDDGVFRFPDPKNEVCTAKHWKNGPSAGTCICAEGALDEHQMFDELPIHRCRHGYRWTIRDGRIYTYAGQGGHEE